MKQAYPAFQLLLAGVWWNSRLWVCGCSGVSIEQPGKTSRASSRNFARRL